MNAFWFWLGNFWWMYVAVIIGTAIGEFLFNLYRNNKNGK